MNLAIGDEPLGLLPLEGDDPLGEEPLGGLLPRGRVLAVGRVLVTVASSADGSGTAPTQCTISGLEDFFVSQDKCMCVDAWAIFANLPDTMPV
jgi:hypothetical protein